MRTFLRVFLAFIAGFVATYVVTVTAVFGLMPGQFHGDGGAAIGAIFMIGPLAGLIGGTIAAIAIPIWLGRRETARAATGEPRKRWPPKRRAAVAAIAWGAGAFFVTRFLQWLFFEGVSFSTYASALAVAFAPHVTALAAAAIAATIVLRGAQREATS